MQNPIACGLSMQSPEVIEKLMFPLIDLPKKEQSEVIERIKAIIALDHPALDLSLGDFNLNSNGNLELTPMIEDLTDGEALELAIRSGRLPDDKYDYIFNPISGEIEARKKGSTVKNLGNGAVLEPGTIFHPQMGKYIELWNPEILKIIKPYSWEKRALLGN